MTPLIFSSWSQKLQEFEVKLYENKRELKRIIEVILEGYCGIIRVEVCKSNSNTIFQKIRQIAKQNKLGFIFPNFSLGFIILSYTI